MTSELERFPRTDDVTTPVLAALHRKLAPRTYLEIGVSDGRSLTLSRARSIGVDPAFKVTAPVCCDLELVRATSDEFFAERRPSSTGPPSTSPSSTDSTSPSSPSAISSTSSVAVPRQA
ncbi:MAG: hypothetical protein WKF58_01960 [Ilumatobacteraceae bacterium]